MPNQRMTKGALACPLDTLADIEETVLIYPSTGGRPKARGMLTETTPTQDHLAEIFDLHRWAPPT